MQVDMFGSEDLLHSAEKEFESCDGAIFAVTLLWSLLIEQGTINVE